MNTVIIQNYYNTFRRRGTSNAQKNNL